MGVLPVVATDETESLQEQCLGIVGDHWEIPQSVGTPVDRLGLALTNRFRIRDRAAENLRHGDLVVPGFATDLICALLRQGGCRRVEEETSHQIRGGASAFRGCVVAGSGSGLRIRSDSFLLAQMKLPTTAIFALLLSAGEGWSQSAQAGDGPAPEIPRAIPIDPEEKILKPGEFLWHPERSPEGPLLVVCTIDDQMLYAYRNGVEIARSTVSTGRKGKKTPTGVFTILQRKVDHESSIYKGAKMPYMQRLTWTGIAMHAGKLPGYPASAGCIRLPYEFSKLIFGEMQNGSTVVITQKKSTPSKSDTPASILLDTKVRNLTNRPIPKGEVVWEPEKSPHGPVSILLSYADKTVYVWRNGVQIGQSPVGFNTPTEELPDGVFLMLAGEDSVDPDQPELTLHPWSVLSLSGAKVKGDVVKFMRDSCSLPPEFRAAINRELHPGALLLATHDASTNDTRSGPIAIGVPDQDENPEGATDEQ